MGLMGSMLNIPQSSHNLVAHPLCAIVIVCWPLAILHHGDMANQGDQPILFSKAVPWCSTLCIRMGDPTCPPCTVPARLVDFVSCLWRCFFVDLPSAARLRKGWNTPSTFGPLISWSQRCQPNKVGLAILPGDFEKWQTTWKWEGSTGFDQICGLTAVNFAALPSKSKGLDMNVWGCRLTWHRVILQPSSFRNWSSIHFGGTGVSIMSCGQEWSFLMVDHGFHKGQIRLAHCLLSLFLGPPCVFNRSWPGKGQKKLPATELWGQKWRHSDSTGTATLLQKHMAWTISGIPRSCGYGAISGLSQNRLIFFGPTTSDSSLSLVSAGWKVSEEPSEVGSYRF